MWLPLLWSLSACSSAAGEPGYGRWAILGVGTRLYEAKGGETRSAVRSRLPAFPGEVVDVLQAPVLEEDGDWVRLRTNVTLDGACGLPIETPGVSIDVWAKTSSLLETVGGTRTYTEKGPHGTRTLTLYPGARVAEEFTPEGGSPSRVIEQTRWRAYAPVEAGDLVRVFTPDPDRPRPKAPWMFAYEASGVGVNGTFGVVSSGPTLDVSQGCVHYRGPGSLRAAPELHVPRDLEPHPEWRAPAGTPLSFQDGRPAGTVTTGAWAAGTPVSPRCVPWGGSTSAVVCAPVDLETRVLPPKDR